VPVTEPRIVFPATAATVVKGDAENKNDLDYPLYDGPTPSRDYLNPEFVADIRSIPTTVGAAIPLWGQLIEAYGTHFVEKVDMGGRAIMEHFMLDWQVE
jgi:hypothetical protein